jgi:hypothetical protein
MLDMAAGVFQHRRNSHSLGRYIAILDQRGDQTVDAISTYRCGGGPSTRYDRRWWLSMVCSASAVPPPDLPAPMSVTVTETSCPRACSGQSSRRGASV